MDNNSLIQVMPWRPTGAKPLPEPMITDAYKYYQTIMFYVILFEFISILFLCTFQVTPLNIAWWRYDM